MSKLGYPSINIIFKQKAAEAIQSGDTGIVGLAVRNGTLTNIEHYTIKSPSDIPSSISETNKNYVLQALNGSPAKVELIVAPNDTLIDDMLNALEAVKFNVGAFPGVDELDIDAIATWTKNVRDNKNKKIMMVLPHVAGDHEGIVNFTTDDIEVDGKIYNANEYTARIAGIIAGLPLTVAPTFQVLSEVLDVPRLTEKEASEKIGNGELILYFDGEKVKIARGVTSLTSITEDKGNDWKKIKLVRTYDLIYDDLTRTIEDNYIGKKQNSYTNKLLLISAINAYFETLEAAGILDDSEYNGSEIDIDAQRTFLKAIGYETQDGRTVEDMSEQEIKEANTKDKVFIKARIRALDAIEDFDMKINI